MKSATACILTVTIILQEDNGEALFADGFAFFSAAIRGETQVAPTDFYALETNLTVVEILEAAKESHRTGKTVSLEELTMHTLQLRYAPRPGTALLWGGTPGDLN